MYQPTTADDLNTWSWLGDGSGLGPPPPQAPLIHPVSVSVGADGQEQDGQNQGLHGPVNGNGLNDPVSYYDTYQYHSYNYGAPTEAQYVGTLFHADPHAPSGSGNAISEVVTMPIIPNGDGGEEDRNSPSIYDLSTHAVPPSEVDAASLLDISSVSGTSSIMNMDLSSHIATSLHQGTEGGQETLHEHETYNSYASAAGQGLGFSQDDNDTELRIKTEDMYSQPHHVDGFIPTAPIQRGSNGCIFARKSKPSTSNGNGFSVDVDEFDEYEDEESQESYDSYDLEADPGSSGRMSREQRRLQRMDANTRAVQIQNQRNAQHPNARKCEICGNLFRGKLVLRRHQIVIHKLRLPNWEQVLAAEERNNAKVPCDLCGKEVARRSMNIHLSQVHRGGRVAVPHKGKFKRGVGRNLGRPRKAVPFLEPQAAPRGPSTSTTNGNRGAAVDYSYLLRQEYQPFAPVERFTNIAKAVARYEEYVAARITKKRRSSSFDSAAWKKNLPPAICNLCGNVFRHKYTLRVHQAKVHKMPVPRLYTKRTPTPSPVKISGQAHAPPPPPSAVRALFRSASTPAYAEPPKLELESHDEDYGSNSPSMPHLTPVTGDSPAPTPSTSASMINNLPRRRPMPASRRLALASASAAAAPGGVRASTRVVVAGDKANANAANRVLIRYSKSLDDLQSPHLQPRPHQRPWLHEGNHVQLHESTSTTMVQKRPRGRPKGSKNKNRPRQVGPKSEVSEVKKRRRRRRRHQRWSRSLPLNRRQQGHQHASNIGASVRTLTTDSITSSRSNLFYNVKPTAKQLREIQHRQVVINVFPLNSASIRFHTTKKDGISKQSSSSPRLRSPPPNHHRLIRKKRRRHVLKSQKLGDQSVAGRQCHLCMKVFYSRRNLRWHLVNVHKQQVHWTSHPFRPGGLRCNICNLRFSKRYMYTHLNEKHGVREDYARHFVPVTPDDAEKSKFESVKQEEQADARVHQVQGAPLPKLTSEHHERRKRLIAKVHQRKRAKIRRCAPAKRGRWVCSICQRVMSTKRCLDDHQILIHGLKLPGVNYPALLARLEKASSKVECKICGRKIRRSNYPTHFRDVHGGIVQKRGSFSQYFTEFVQKSSIGNVDDEDDDQIIDSEAEGGLQETLLPSTSSTGSEFQTEESKLRCKLCRMVLPQSAMLMHLKVTHQHRYINPSLVVNYSIPVPPSVSSKVVPTLKEESAELSDLEPPEAELNQEHTQEFEMRTCTRPGQVTPHPASSPKYSARVKRQIAADRHREHVRIIQAVKRRFRGPRGSSTCSICQRVMYSPWSLRRHEVAVHGFRMPDKDYTAVIADMQKVRTVRSSQLSSKAKVQCKICGCIGYMRNFSRHLRHLHNDELTSADIFRKPTHEYFTRVPPASPKKIKTEVVKQEQQDSPNPPEPPESEYSEAEFPDSPKQKPEPMKELRIKLFRVQIPATCHPKPTAPDYTKRRKRHTANVSQRRRRRVKNKFMGSAKHQLSGPKASRTCYICHRVLANNWCLRRHILVVHGLKLPGFDYTDMLASISRTRALHSIPVQVQCKLCGVTRCRAQFRRHLRTMHMMMNVERTQLKQHYIRLPSPAPTRTKLPNPEYRKPESPELLELKQEEPQTPEVPRPVTVTVSSPSKLPPELRERRKRLISNAQQRRRVKNKFKPSVKHQLSGPKASRTCHICRQVLNSSHSLRRHLLLVHEFRIPGVDYSGILAQRQAQKQKPSYKKQGNVQCKLCGGTRSKPHFRRHLRLMHQNVNVRTLGKRYLKQYYLQLPSPSPTPTKRPDPKYREPESPELLELKQEEPQTPEVKRPVTASTPPKLSHELRERRNRLITNVYRKQRTGDSQKGPSVCSVCHRHFSSRQNLRRHQFLCHGIKVPNADYSAVIADAKGKVECKLCGNICYRCNFKRHFRNKHENTVGIGLKPLTQYYTKLPSLSGHPKKKSKKSQQAYTPNPDTGSQSQSESGKVCCNICGKFFAKTAIYPHLKLKHERRNSYSSYYTPAPFSPSPSSPATKSEVQSDYENPDSPSSLPNFGSPMSATTEDSQCSTSSSAFTSASTSSSGLQCKICLKEFRHHGSLRDHQVFVHKQQIPGHERISKNRRRSVRCNFCSTVFSRSAVYLHLKIMHGVRGEFPRHFTVLSPKSKGRERARVNKSSEQHPQDQLKTEAYSECQDSDPDYIPDSPATFMSRSSSKACTDEMEVDSDKDQGSPELPASKPASYQCAKCPKVFPSWQARAGHQTRGHMVASSNSPVALSNKAFCLLCDKVTQKNNIVGHLRRKHSKKDNFKRFFKLDLQPGNPNDESTPHDQDQQDNENAADEDHQHTEIVRCNICQEVMPRATVGRHLIAQHDQRHGFWRFFEVIDETEDEDGEQAEHDGTDGESEPTPTGVRRQSRRIPIVKKKQALKRKLSESSSSSLSIRARKRARLNEIEPEDDANESPESVAVAGPSGTCNQSPSKSKSKKPRRGKQKRGHWLQKVQEKAKAAKEFSRLCLEMMTRKLVIKVHRVKVPPNTSVAAPPVSTTEEVDMSGESGPSSTLPLVVEAGEDFQPPVSEPNPLIDLPLDLTSNSNHETDPDEPSILTTATEAQPVPEDPEEVENGTPIPNTTDVEENNLLPVVVAQSEPEQNPSPSSTQSAGVGPAPDERPPKKKFKKLYVDVEDCGLRLGICRVCDEPIPFSMFTAHQALHTVECHLCGKNVLHTEVAEHGVTHVSSLKCEECGQVFKQAIALWEHMNRHLHVEPLLCIWCGTRFASQAARRTHILIQHTNIAPFSCALCDRKFTTRLSKRKHEARHCGSGSGDPDAGGNNGGGNRGRGHGRRGRGRGRGGRGRGRGGGGSTNVNTANNDNDNNIPIDINTDSIEQIEPIPEQELLTPEPPDCPDDNPDPIPIPLTPTPDIDMN